MRVPEILGTKALQARRTIILEQFAAIPYRYTKGYKGCDVSAAGVRRSDGCERFGPQARPAAARTAKRRKRDGGSFWENRFFVFRYIYRKTFFCRKKRFRMLHFRTLCTTIKVEF